VTKRGWMDGIGGCPNVGGICIGCTMPGFPDKFMPFMDEPPGGSMSGMLVRPYGSFIRLMRGHTNKTANTEPKNGKALVIMLADVDRSSFSVTAPSQPGTFDVFNPTGTSGIPPAHLAVVRFGVNESCAEVPGQSAVATSGAVKLTSVSASGYAGTYTIGLETGEQISGEFHTASCPGLATYLATPTHSCGG